MRRRTRRRGRERGDGRKGGRGRGGAGGARCGVVVSWSVAVVMSNVRECIWTWCGSRATIQGWMELSTRGRVVAPPPSFRLSTSIRRFPLLLSSHELLERRFLPCARWDGAAEFDGGGGAAGSARGGERGRLGRGRLLSSWRVPSLRRAWHQAKVRGGREKRAALVVSSRLRIDGGVVRLLYPSCSADTTYELRARPSDPFQAKLHWRMRIKSSPICFLVEKSALVVTKTRNRSQALDAVPPFPLSLTPLLLPESQVND